MQRLFLCTLSLFISCTSSSTPEKEQQHQIETQLKSDEARMDSLEKAIQDQMQSVSDDSVINSSTSR